MHFSNEVQEKLSFFTTMLPRRLWYIVCDCGTRSCNPHRQFCL